MRWTRRDLLKTATMAAFGRGGLSPAKSSLAGLRIGVTDWNLQQTGKVEAVGLANKIGFDGVEVSLGRRITDNRLPLDNAELQDRYLAEAARLNMRIAGTCLDVLHVNYLKNDKLGQRWLGEGIPITRKLKARVMLLPFFGKGALETRQEMDYVGDVLRELGPEAEKAGVILGLENTISAEDNVRIMERAKSKAVLVYYDIGNSTRAGFDVLKEIPWLGKDRICQFHFKDNPHYLGEGSIDIRGVIRAVAGLGGFEGFGNLETSSPSKSVEEDMKRNLSYLRKLISEVGAG